jgi:trans-aconitate methyltransferase
MNLNYQELNERQLAAETDEFTAQRYRQFGGLLPKNCVKILDIGCSTGRGGAELKRIRPLIQLYGLDCSQKRLARVLAAY